MSAEYVAYYRVSTDKQGRSGLGLEAQRQSVENLMTRNNGEVISEYVEIESGKREDRPELVAAIEAAKSAKATLVVAKLDRLSRSVAFIAALLESHVDFVVADMPEANRLTIHILAAVAEHEREMISQRTREALAAAKKRGVRLGNPMWEDAVKRARAAHSARAKDWAEGLRPVVDGLRAMGRESLREMAHGFEEANIKTRRGSKTWTPTTVQRLLAHLDS